MRRILGQTVASVVLVLGVTTYAASANNVHYKTAPSFTDNGLTLTAAGALAGLGNTDLQVDLTATGNPTAICSNGGTQQPPGQNPAAVTETGSVSIPASAIKNGNAPFSVSTAPPASPIPGAPGCPNAKNWTETITDVSFTSASITVQQPVGTTVLTTVCAFNPPTSNGSVLASSVSCTSH